MEKETLPASADPAEALAAADPGDTTGTETLARYEYQIKVAVHRWLATLASDAESRVVCEFVDDITTLTSSSITFAQVKTRDRGSWSVSKIFESGGGLDALARSYLLARTAGCHELVRLELILEGPPGTGKDTRRFFANPSSATADERKRVAKLGVVWPIRASVLPVDRSVAVEWLEAAVGTDSEVPDELAVIVVDRDQILRRTHGVPHLRGAHPTDLIAVVVAHRHERRCARCRFAALGCGAAGGDDDRRDQGRP